MPITRIVLFLMLAILPFRVWAADIRIERTPDGNSFLIVKGEIAIGDDQKFNNLAIQLKQTTVFLNSPGGLVDPGMEIGKTINIKGFSTAVMPNEVCASTCALIWLAGRPRGLFNSSKIGFHAVFTVDSGQPNVSGSGNALVGAYLQKLGLNEQTIFFVTNTKPDTFDWLDANEAKQIGLDVMVLADTASQPTPYGDNSKTSDASAFPKESQSSSEGLPKSSTDTSSQVPEVTRDWATLQDSDLPGYDLPGMPLSSASPDECKAACNLVGRCVAYTFNAAFGKCFLKSHAFESLQYTGALSGYDIGRVTVSRVGSEVGAIGFRTSSGHEIVSPPYLAFKNSTLAWCQDKCISQKRCTGFNFYQGGECRLLRAKKPTRRNNVAFSGIRLD
ncbi:hypothetical protein IHQ71_20615 [Rhizobium sp. TH2]|uniref:PAN domain-containing protein n=1 Tax=Rhizobium sp. TH2 TaxID=2775403 RepID=UPI0021581DFB|nr:PAN domain-containing protein [Rhizobium sp. TH2]UVC07583.1 hypothetical protein IHQ71_20615 [Rhizobium sp. TH2]